MGCRCGSSEFCSTSGQVGRAYARRCGSTPAGVSPPLARGRLHSPLAVALASGVRRSAVLAGRQRLAVPDADEPAVVVLGQRRLADLLAVAVELVDAPLPRQAHPAVRPGDQRGRVERALLDVIRSCRSGCFSPVYFFVFRSKKPKSRDVDSVAEVDGAHERLVARRSANRCTSHSPIFDLVVYLAGLQIDDHDAQSRSESAT